MFSSSEVAAPIAVSSPVVNRHDDDFDVDMERVLSAVMNDNANAQPTAAAADSTRPAGSSSGNPRRDVRQTSAETASPARGWDVFTQWVQRESAAQHPLPNSTAVRTPTPVLALHGAASLAHHSASFDPAETTLASRALGTSTPPNASGSFHHHAGSPNYWQAMATPPRTQKSDNSVAMHSEYAYTPATVMPSQDRQSSMNQTRGFAYDETTTPGSNQRRAAVGGAIFYSLSSPTSNGAGAATQFPAPQDSPAKRLNTTAAPFTPQRYGGAGYVDPAAGASWSSPHSAGTYSTPSGYHTTLQPLTPPSASANPALTATPLGFSAAPFPIELVKSNPVAAAKDQQGCRTLQRILELQWAHPDVQEVFAGLFPSLPELMADAYGNFLVQKLLDVAPDDVRLRIAQLVSPHLAHIATTPHGTFAAQKLVDSLRSSEERTAVCEGLAGAVVALCTDHNGAHVVQKVIAAVGPDEREVLVVQVSNYIVDIAKNRYGTCIVQRCIERCVGAAVQFDALASAIVANVTPLILDPYGNYVVQRLIEQCAPRSRAIDEIVNQLTLQTVDVLKHVVTSQFSSKAVEKALQRASIAVSSAFCDALSVDGVLEDCIGDQFGNYIVQTGLGLAAAPIDPTALNSPNPRTPPVSNLSGGFTVSGSDRNTPTSKLTLPSEYTVEGTTPEQQMARVIARFVRFTSCVERNIHTVHLATFGRKMETKLDHAQRNLRVAAGRSTASTASRGTPPQPSVRGRRNTPPIATTPPAHHHQMVMHHHGPIIAAQNANAAAVSFHHHASASHPVAPLHTATTAAQQQQGVPRGTPPPEPTLRRRPPSHASSSPNSAPAS